MAEKQVFFSDDKKAFREEIINYTYYSGFAVSQKQKSISSLHEEIEKKYPDRNVLEVSTKSEEELGQKLSAFNLNIFDKERKDYRSVENVFQSSKVFEWGGPFTDLLNVHPRDAKRDERLKSSGELTGFRLDGKDWPLEPKTMFYDWIYISALKENKDLADEVIKYDCFTDIEFNYKKSINCQARSAAIFVSLHRQGTLGEKTESMKQFRTIYLDGDGEQTMMF